MTDTTTEEDDEKDGWFIDQTIHINLPSDISEADLLKSLEANRARLKRLKYQYWQLRKEYELNDPECKNFRSEMSRAVNALEAIKDKLALKATDYDFTREDREHPERARRLIEREKIAAQKQAEWEAEQKRLEAEQRRLEAMDPISRFFHDLFH